MCFGIFIMIMKLKTLLIINLSSSLDPGDHLGGFLQLWTVTPETSLGFVTSKSLEGLYDSRA